MGNVPKHLPVDMASSGLHMHGDVMGYIMILYLSDVQLRWDTPSPSISYTRVRYRSNVGKDEREHPLGMIVSGSKPLRCICSKSYRAFSGCSPFSQALMSVLGSRPLRCIPAKRSEVVSGCSPFSQALMSVLGSRPHGAD